MSLFCMYFISPHHFIVGSYTDQTSLSICMQVNLNDAVCYYDVRSEIVLTKLRLGFLKYKNKPVLTPEPPVFTLKNTLK
jgi:hypothetical protein